jgi:hypothetical protein
VFDQSMLDEVYAREALLLAQLSEAEARILAASKQQQCAQDKLLELQSQQADSAVGAEEEAALVGEELESTQRRCAPVSASTVWLFA